MTVVDLLGDHVCGTGGGGLELRPINYRGTSHRTLSSGDRRVSGGGISNRHRMNLGVSCRGHALHFNALVNDGVVVDGVIVDDRGVIVDLRDLGWRQPAPAQIMIIEVSQTNEGEMFGS